MPPDSLIRRWCWGTRKEGNLSHLYHSKTGSPKPTDWMICKGRINCPSELSILRYDGIGRTGWYYKTERASNLTLSQSVIELAIRLAEKESLTLFLSDGISPPSDIAKIINFFRLDALKSNLFYKNKNFEGSLIWYKDAWRMLRQS